MTVDTERITRERLEEWRRVLQRAHATPALLLGVGHDEHDGEVHVLVPKDLDVLMIIAFLQIATKQLAQRVPLSTDDKQGGPTWDAGAPKQF